MHMKKKVLSIILSGVLLIGNVPVTIYADNTGGIEQKVADELVIVDEEGKELESPFYLDVGDSEKFSVQGATGEVEWSSSNPLVAQVDKDGNITAKASGDTDIIAKMGERSQSIRVTTGVPVTKIEAVNPNVILGIGEEVDVRDVDGKFGYITDPQTIDTHYNWVELSTGNDNGPVDIFGNDIEGRYEGTDTVTLIITSLSGKAVSCTWNVEVKNIVTEINIEDMPFHYEAGEEYRIRPKFRPHDASLEGLTYSSTNEQVATVDNNGLLKAISPGRTIITIQCGNAVSKRDISVYEPITSIKFREDNFYTVIDGYIGTNSLLEYTPESTYLIDRNIEYLRSDNPDIATIGFDSIGNLCVEGKKVGSTILHLKYKNLPEISCGVTVGIVGEASRFDANPQKSNLYIGETTETEITNIWPEGAMLDRSKIKWESSNSNVAAIDENGEITAVSAGEAFFDVYYDGEFITSFNIIVADPDDEKVTIIIEGIHDGNKLYVGAEYNMYVKTPFNGLQTADAKIDVGDTDILKVEQPFRDDAPFIVKPQKVGKTKLTATVDGESKEIEIEVVELDEITLDTSSVSGVNNAETLYVGKPISFWLCDNGSVSNIPEYSFRVQSNNPSIVDAEIMDRYRLDLTPKKVGTATITITCNEDPRKKLVINSTVKEYVPIEELKFDQELVYMNVGDTFTQKVNVTPTNGTIWGQATYGTSANYIAIVDEKTGEVTAKAPGTVRIMYLLPGAPNKTAGYTVVVRDKDDDSGEGSGGGTIIISPNDQPTVDLSKNGLNLKVGESVDVTATVKNSSKPVKWESSNPDCVEVSDGKITALHQGIAVVTAKSGTAVGFCLIVVEGDELNGWQQDKVSKKWYYLENGKAQTGWIKEDGEYYYCDPKNSGAMTENKWIVIEEPDPYNNNKVGEVWYRVDENGKMQTGWISDPEAPWKIYLLDTNGRMMHSDWVNAPENQELNRPAGMYYLTDDGAVQMNGWTLAKNSNSVYWYCNPGTGLFESGNPNSWAGKNYGKIKGIGNGPFIL